MRKQLKRLSLKEKPLEVRIITTLVMILILILGFVTVYFLSISSKQSINSMRDSIKSSLTYCSGTLDIYLNSINDIAIDAGYLLEIQEWVSNEQTFEQLGQSRETLASLLKDKFLKSAFYSNVSSLQSVAQVDVFLNGEHLCNVYTNSTSSRERTGKVLSLYDSISESHDIMGFVKYKGVLYHVRQMTNWNTMETLSFITTLNGDKLIEACMSMMKNHQGKAYLMNPQGKVYLCTDEDLMEQTISVEGLDALCDGEVHTVSRRGEKVLLAGERLYYPDDFYFITEVPVSVVHKNVYGGIKDYLLFALLFSCCVIFLSVAVLRQTTRLMNAFSKAMHQIEQDDYSVRMPKFYYTDDNRMAQQFNKMASRIQFLIEKEYQNALLLKNNEIKMLQAQINPHFLFNTLIVIETQAHMTGDQKLCKMISSLNGFLRASIITSQSSVSVKKEIEYVEFYLFLQKSRFEEKFSYEICVEDDEIYDYLVPRFSIEPIVENAVVHGIENVLQNGLVRIDLYRLHGDLVIDVYDNGKGFDPAIINLQDETVSAADVAAVSKGSIGLQNVNSRIKLLYGSHYGICIRSNPQEGTLVKITLPVVEFE